MLSKYKKILSFIIIITLSITITGCSNKFDCENGKHDLKWIVVEESTCTSLGTKQLVCKQCNEILTTASINLKEHNIVIDEKIESTCTSTGLTEGSHCSNCGLVISNQEVTPAIGHHYVLDDNLSNDETLVYKCQNCNDTYEKINNGICVNHTPGEWVVIEEATCSKVGLKQKQCVECGIILENKEIEKNQHTETIIPGVDATCTNTGLSEGKKCNICGTILINQEIIPCLGHNYIITNTQNPTETSKGFIEYTCSICNDCYIKEIDDLSSYDSTLPTTIIFDDNNILIENNNGGIIIENNILNINLAGEYDLTGVLNEGAVVVSVKETEKVILNLKNVKITSSLTHPIYIESAEKVEISAKADTINYIEDNRKIEEDSVGAAIYSKVDLEIKGKGELNIASTYNNGIASTKDLEIKNLILNVNAPNNAIKGNDSLTIQSGIIKAISSSGDALKTENTDISEKGNQRGIITINDGEIELYAACDGIDASYDVIINGGNIKIFTESYSSYSGEVTVTSSSMLYIRVSRRAGLQESYKYSAKFTDEDGNVTWVDASNTGNMQYELKVPTGAKYVTFYCYSSSQTQGQDTNYSYKSDQLTIPTSMDQYYITSKSTENKTLDASWENHSTSQGGPGGRPGGMGGQNGNNNKADYSCKGIKADNGIVINGGNIEIKSHDDAIHTNLDVVLDSGDYGEGYIIINGGNMTLYSDDDAIHADKDLTINGGDIVITNSYEGIEGNNIYFNGGVTQIKSSDDGTNAKTSLNFNDGIVYLDASGDGIDSNGSVIMKGGIVLALGPSNGGNGVLDYDRSFTFSGGLLLAIGCNGMNQKPTATSGNTATSKIISTSTNSFVNVVVDEEVIAVIKVTKNSQNYCVFAYNNDLYDGASVTVTTSNSKTLVNGLYYTK